MTSEEKKIENNNTWRFNVIGFNGDVVCAANLGFDDLNNDIIKILLTEKVVVKPGYVNNGRPEGGRP